MPSLTMHVVIELNPLNVFLLSILAIVCVLNIVLLLVLAVIAPLAVVLWFFLGTRLALHRIRQILCLVILGLGAVTNKTLHLLLASLLNGIILAYRLGRHVVCATIKAFVFSRFALWRVTIRLVFVVGLWLLVAASIAKSTLQSVTIWATKLLLQGFVVGLFLLGASVVKLARFVHPYSKIIVQIGWVGLVQLARIMVEGVSLADHPVPPQALAISTRCLPIPPRDYSLILSLVALHGHAIRASTVPGFGTFTGFELLSAYQCSYYSSLRLVSTIQARMTSSAMEVLVLGSAHSILVTVSLGTTQCSLLASRTASSIYEVDDDKTLCESFSDIKVDYEKILCESFSTLKIDSPEEHEIVEHPLDELIESPSTSERKKLVPSRMRAFAQALLHIKPPTAAAASEKAAQVCPETSKPPSKWKGRIPHSVRRARKREKKALEVAATAAAEQ